VSGKSEKNGQSGKNGRAEGRILGEDVFTKTPSPNPSPKTFIAAVGSFFIFRDFVAVGCNRNVRNSVNNLSI
jgi:hypothetical protein